MAGVTLYDYQLDAINRMKIGCILCGGVGSGKSRTSLAFYYKLYDGEVNTENYVRMTEPPDLYIITTARKRDTGEWDEELAHFYMSTDPEHDIYEHKVVVDSWNNIGKYVGVKNAFFISFVGIGLLSVALEAVCLLLIDPILSFLQIPLEIWSDTHDYLFYIFLGILFTFLYNYFASLLRALGDSRTPLLFLGVSAIGNIILDIYFIVSLHMGVAGAAIATTMSQALSAIGLFVYVFFQQRDLLPQKEYWYFDKSVFQKIKDYSLLTCVQQSVMNFGILLIQGLVNSFGLVTMSAFAAAVKIDSFAYMPVQDFGNAYSTFVAQNKGAGLEERIRKGTKSAVIVAALFCFLISTIVFNFADTLMLIFIKPEQTEIILKGAEYLRIEGACYLGIGLLFLLYGYYRGVGKPGISVVLTIVSLGTRVLLSYALAPTLGEHMIWWSIPIGWFLADAIGVVQGIRKEKWFSRKRAEDEKVFND